MNRRGFTLIELLAVIIIISILTILVFPKITNSVKNYSNKTDELMIDMIKNAAKLYMEDNASSFEENSYGYYCISLNELIDKDYLKDGIEISGEDATYTKRLKITYGNNYKIDIVDSHECVILDPGLYDENNIQLATWDELIEAGLDLESDFTFSTSPNKSILNSYGNNYKLVVDNSVTRIGNNALDECTKLIEIIIPNTVISIGTNAFCGNSSLTSITLPSSIISIAAYAFQNCSSLTNIIIPESVISIGNAIFIGCNKLESIVVDENNRVYDSRDNSNAIIQTSSNTLVVGLKNTVIPDSVTSIGPYAFYRSGLTNIIIPDNVTNIGNDAFAYNSNITSITIPKSVISIGNGAFSGCSKLQSIEVDENNRVYDSRDNSNAIIETARNKLIAGCKNTIIPSSVTSIGPYAFSGCSSLTSITIPSSVTSIGINAFSSCSSLTSIAIPSSVTSIEKNAFNYCNNLTTIYYSGTATGSPWGAPSAIVVSE